MKHELSKEHLEKIASWREKYGAGHNVMLTAEEAEALARFALAAHEQELAAHEQEPVAHEQEPVAYMYRDNLHADARFSLEPRFSNWSPEDINEYEISETPLYTHPAPSTPAAMPEEMTADCAWGKHGVSAEDCSAWADGWNARAAMLQSEQVGQWVVRSDQRLMETPVTVPDIVGKLLAILDRHTVVLGWGEKPITLAELVVARDGSDELDACRTAMLQSEPQNAPQNIPVNIPEGYALVPIEPTEDMVIHGFESEPDKFFSEPEVWAAYQAMSGCRQAAHRARLCWSAMLAAVPKEA